MKRCIGKFHCWPVIALGVAVTVGPRLQAAPPGNRTTRKPLPVSVKTIGPDALEGGLLAFSLDDGILLRGADEDQRVPLMDVVQVHTATTISSHSSKESAFTLVGGDRLFGRISGAENESVVVETTDLGSLVVPLESIIRIDTTRAHQPEYTEIVEWFHQTGQGRPGTVLASVGSRVASPHFGQERRTNAVTTLNPNADPGAESGDDLILLANGDIVRGFIIAIDEEGVAIESSLGETKVPHPFVLAVRFASPPAQPPARPFLLVTLQHSGRFTVTDMDWSTHAVELQLVDGQQIRVDAERIVRVDVVGGRWEWLPAHRPISYEHTPMLSLGWDYANHRNVLGGPITVAGEVFEHGVGVHSRSRLTYELKGAYHTFVTRFGIDDDSGPFADVSVLILVDGKTRFEKTGVCRGTLHGPIRLDIARANRIELITDFGRNGDLQDRFNWVEPALIR